MFLGRPLESAVCTPVQKMNKAKSATRYHHGGIWCTTLNSPQNHVARLEIKLFVLEAKLFSLEIISSSLVLSIFFLCWHMKMKLIRYGRTEYGQSFQSSSVYRKDLYERNSLA